MRHDFLATLQSALAARGLEYDVPARVTNADEEFSADVDGRIVDVRLTDHDVILAREATTRTGNARTGTYADVLSMPVGEDEFVASRGYALVDADVAGVALTFATTHLESASTAIREAQVRELLDRLDAVDRPVVLVGDFNCGPETDAFTYGLLTARFDDAVRTATEDEPADGSDVTPGPTCCQRTYLRNDESSLS